MSNADTVVITSSTISSPTPAPSPLPVDLTNIIAAVTAAQSAAASSASSASASAGSVSVNASNAAASELAAANSASAAASSAALSASYATGLSIGTVSTGTPNVTITGVPGSLKMNFTLPPAGAPTSTVLGGVFSSSAPANEFTAGVDTSGNLVYSALTASNVTAALTFTPINKAGDTFTGNVTISAANNSTLTLDASSAGYQPSIFFQQAATNKWQIGAEGSTDASFFVYNCSTATTVLFIDFATDITVVAGGIALTGLDPGGAHLRMENGGYGAFLRNDGTSLWILGTPSGSPAGTWNSYRPFEFNLTTGVVNLDGGGNGLVLGTAASTPSVPGNLSVGGSITVVASVTAATATVNSAAVNGVGKVEWFAFSAAPAGYMTANGAAVSRTTYATLFNAIGTTFGAGDGSTTFNLPDLRGAFVRGWDNGRGLDSWSGRPFGTYQGDQFGSHGHGVNDPGHSHGVNDPGHAHGYTSPNGAPSYYQGAYGPYTNLSGAPVGGGTNGNGTGIWLSGSGTSISIQASGGAETNPKNVALLPCIKY